HPELNDVEEILQQVLVLPVAHLNGECNVRHPVLQCERGRKGCAWTLARRDNIEWILDLIEHEALHALREADSGVAGNHRGDPATARRNRYDPTFLVGGDNGSRSGKEAAAHIRVGVASDDPSVGLGDLAWLVPAFKELGVRIHSIL